MLSLFWGKNFISYDWIAVKMHFYLGRSPPFFFKTFLFCVQQTSE